MTSHCMRSSRCERWSSTRSTDASSVHCTLRLQSPLPHVSRLAATEAASGERVRPEAACSCGGSGASLDTSTARRHSICAHTHTNAHAHARTCVRTRFTNARTRTQMPTFHVGVGTGM
eukprot:3404500-Pleurochrysis_carterae.AAC.1